MPFLIDPPAVPRIERCMKATPPILAALLLCPALRSQVPPCPAHVSHIHIETGDYSSGPGVTFQLHHFSATLVPMGKTAPSCYQKLTVVSHAEIFVSNESLTNVFTDKLGATGSKIKDFKVRNDIGKVTLNGRVNKIIPIEFSIEGPVRTDGTAIILDAKKIKADGIPIKALLQILGEHLSSVLKLNHVKGITVDENSISFFPEQIAHLKGNLAAVIPSADGLTLRYETKARTPAAQPPHP